MDVTIDAASVNTHMPVRDNQVRSADFLDVTVNGFSPDTFGATRSSFGAITKIDRTEAVLQTGANGA